MTSQPSCVATTKTRSVKGRGSSRPERQTGMVERRTSSCATRSPPRRMSRASTARPVGGAELARAHGLRAPRPVRDARPGGPQRQRIEPLEHVAAHLVLPAPPRRDVGNGERSSPERRPASDGTKPIRPGLSSTPEPSALASVTAPPRTACTRPGTPSRDEASSSSGSANSESSRRTRTFIRFSPPTVRTWTAPSRTVRSPPSTSRKPR